MGEYAPNHEVRYHTPHVAQEFRNAHGLPRLIRLLDHRVLAVCFHGWPCRGPYEVRPANTGIPEVVQFHNYLLLHLFQHTAIPTWASRLRAFFADEPDR